MVHLGRLVVAIQWDMCENDIGGRGSRKADEKSFSLHVY
jgi:hypothetical protein